MVKTIEGDSRPDEQKTAPGQMSAVKEAAKLPVVTPATPSGPPPEWKATKTCHHCGVYGHVRTDCPQLKPAAQTPKQINVMRAAEPPPDGPYLPIEVESPNGAGPLCVRMVGHLDSGSDFDGMERNWVFHFEACGGVIVPLKVPEFIGWTDRSVARYEGNHARAYLWRAGVPSRP